MAKRARNVGAMNRFRIHIDATELLQIREYLEQFPLALQSEILAKAFAHAGKPVVAAAKGYADRIADTGLLSKSLGCFVKINRKTKVPYALLTANRKVRETVTRRDGRTMIANPSKYLHLVELGTRHSAASPVLQPALDARGVVAGRRVLDGVERATEHLIKKFERKMRRAIGIR
jgi:hypothetical protein